MGSALPLDGVAPAWGGRRAAEYTRLTLEQYGTVCWLCGLDGANSADHVIPRSVRADLIWQLSNLRPAHKRCNSERGARLIEGPAGIVEDYRHFFKSG